MKRIWIDVDGVRASARLLESEAPRAAARLWAALPIDTPLRQSRWSGNSTYAAVPELRSEADQPERTDVPAESPATFMCPGHVYAGAATGGVGLPYGEAQSRDIGLNTWITEVAALEGDHAALLAALARVRRDGAKRLRITRAP
jgi:hypothetical protein